MERQCISHEEYRFAKKCIIDIPQLTKISGVQNFVVYGSATIESSCKQLE